MPQQGQYSLQDALNRALPVFKRLMFGNTLNAMITTVNSLNAQVDILTALLDSSVAANASGTVTLSGAITNGDAFTLNLINPGIAALITPGLTLGPIPVITGDTLTTLAVKLVVAINSSPVLVAAGFIATNAAGVVTIKSPGTLGNGTLLVFTRTAGTTIAGAIANPSSGTGAVPVRNALTIIPPLNTIP